MTIDSSRLVPGLYVSDVYIDEKEQRHLLQIIDLQEWSIELKRRVQHYGYRYDYTRRNIDASAKLGPLPRWAEHLAERFYSDGLVDRVPDQLIVNEYTPGQGIARHVDCVPCFGDTIMSLSLGSPCLMEFTQRDSTDRLSLLLEPGCLIVMQGEARYKWMHGIPARKTDHYQERLIARGRRVSLTFRCVISAP